MPDPPRDHRRASGATILVIEDDAETRGAIVRELRSGGFKVEEAADGAEAMARWEARRPDVVLLDLGLPDVDGRGLVTRMRRDAATPIIILSGRFAESEKVDALDRGADDYVTKPFGVDELMARIRVALRRSAGPLGDTEGRLISGPLILDVERHAATVDGNALELTPREFEILRVLLSHAGRVVTKGRILRAVWGEAYRGEDSYIYVHVSQLRRKLAAADPTGTLGSLIATEPGIGYRVRVAEDRRGT